MKKEKTSPFTFRIPVSLREELEGISQVECRSLSNQISFALKQFVEERKQETRRGKTASAKLCDGVDEGGPSGSHP